MRIYLRLRRGLRRLLAVTLTLSALAVFAALIRIAPADALTTAPYWEKNSSTIYYDDGNVGLGTNVTGGYRLALKQASSASGNGLRVINANGSKSAQLWVGSSGAVLDAEGSANLHLRTGGTDRIKLFNNGTIHLNGSVGLGTTSPSGKLNILHRNTSARADHIFLQDSTDTAQKLYVGIDGNDEYASIQYVREGAHWGPLVLQATYGNVGIGTTAPDSKLHVNGTIRAGDVYGSGGKNLIVGDDAYLSDLDQANALGIFGIQNAGEATVMFGTGGAKVKGYANGDMCIGNC
jgi:hypothetical protein